MAYKQQITIINSIKTIRKTPRNYIAPLIHRQFYWVEASLFLTLGMKKQIFKANKRIAIFWILDRMARAATEMTYSFQVVPPITMTAWQQFSRVANMILPGNHWK